MAFARANGIEIAYELDGDPADQPILLVMGLGAQLVHWDPDFVAALVRRGFWVIRFDNRDSGLSEKIEGGPEPDMFRALQGDPSSASYTLSDMAADGIGLLDHLGVEQAHVVGVSMGGMIAQHMAIEHPGRVRSLTSIMSTTGNPDVGQATPQALAALLTPPVEGRDANIERSLGIWRVIGSPGFPLDEAYVRRRAAESFERCFYPVGVSRQLLAVVSSGDRTERLADVRVPTLVLHGEEDPLVPISGGRATAAAIPGAELRSFPGMGHDLPRELFQPIADAIAANAARAAGPAPVA